MVFLLVAGLALSIIPAATAGVSAEAAASELGILCKTNVRLPSHSCTYDQPPHPAVKELGQMIKSKERAVGTGLLLPIVAATVIAPTLADGPAGCDRRMM